MYFVYVFILQFCCTSTCFERPFRSSSGVHDLLYLQLCTSHANVSNCSVLRLELVFVYIIDYDPQYIQCQIRTNSISFASRHDATLKWIIPIIYLLNFTICCMEVWLSTCVLFILRWCQIRVFSTLLQTSNDGVWFVLFSLWPCSARTAMMNIPVFIFIRV